MKRLFFLFVAFVLIGCSGKTTNSVSRVAAPTLSEKVSQSRSALIDEISYDLDLNVTQAESFSGAVQIDFQMKKQEATTLDFFKGQVDALVINGKSVNEIAYNGFFVELPKQYLKKGANQVRVQFQAPYSKNGVGLYRSVDPMDGKVYVYTDFEPYDAHHLLPCFDQPDLKATFQSRVVAPKAWEMISTTREDGVKDLGADHRVWSFPKSAKISTYVFSVHGGPYYKWESQVKTPNHVVPLRLFARQSMAKYVKIKDWFVPMQQGFVFFENYFATPYPYGKYDNVIAPDFNSGAMENVAAVTYNEGRYIRRGEMQKHERRRLASVIFHELAHMWFGNLVTMKWWNDLWLNESFATYMANLGMMESTTEFKDDNLEFFSSKKKWGYDTDKSVNTHPIETPVSSTGEAFANFDGISYGKGASVLKQMAFYVGEDAFQKGVASYFKKFAEKNTVLEDFMGEISAASGKDMVSWQKKWLQTAGVNTIEAKPVCKEGLLESLEILQGAPKGLDTLRPHKAQFAILKSQKGIYKEVDRFTVVYDGRRTMAKDIQGKPCPDILVANAGDYDYVQVELDESTVARLSKGLSSIENPLSRAMMWANLWERVKEQKMSATAYLDVVLTQGLTEPVSSTQNKILANVERVLKTYLPGGEDGQVERIQWVQKFENRYRKRILQTKGTSEQKKWYDHFVALAESPEQLAFLEKVLLEGDGGRKLSFALDQERRWKTLFALSVFDFPKAQSLYEKEKARDSSQRGQLASLGIQALEPKLSVKKTFFERVSQGPKAESLYNLSAIMSGLFPFNQKSFHRKFSDDFFKKVQSFGNTFDPVFLKKYGQALVPAFCDRTSSAKIQSFVAANKLPMVLQKVFGAAVQENERCRKIRQKMSQAGQGHP